MARKVTAKQPHQQTAQVIWFDPGQTTGVAVLALDPKWLQGEGDATWEGLARACRTTWFAQLGDEAKEWNGHRAESALVTDYSPHAKFNGPKISEQARNELNMIADAREILDFWPGAAWGYEAYRIESMSAASEQAITPVRFFSVLSFGTIMDDQRPRIPFVQDRSLKYTANDARMKTAGLYMPGMPHATDAARHAAIFARNARKSEAVRKQAWPRLFDREVIARLESERARRKEKSA